MNRDLIAAQLLASLVSLHMSENEDTLVARSVALADKLMAKLQESEPTETEPSTTASAAESDE